jgi:hypothetical protein
MNFKYGKTESELGCGKQGGCSNTLTTAAVLKKLNARDISLLFAD